MKRLKMLFVLMSVVTLTSCSLPGVDAGEEMVLIQKPWFFGSGGVVDEVDALIESKVEVHFGEVLGKHSDVSVIMSYDNLTLVTTEENVIKVIKDYNLENGYNPFNYIYDE